MYLSKILFPLHEAKKKKKRKWRKGELELFSFFTEKETMC